MGSKTNIRRLSSEVSRREMTSIQPATVPDDSKPCWRSGELNERQVDKVASESRTPEAYKIRWPINNKLRWVAGMPRQMVRQEGLLMNLFPSSCPVDACVNDSWLTFVVVFDLCALTAEVRHQLMRTSSSTHKSFVSLLFVLRFDVTCAPESEIHDLCRSLHQDKSASGQCGACDGQILRSSVHPTGQDFYAITWLWQPVADGRFTGSDPQLPMFETPGPRHGEEEPEDAQADEESK
jgi:hypothetical protein